MGIKLPITDKFLLDLYKHLEEANNAVNFVLSDTYKKAWIIRNSENPVFRKYKDNLNKVAFKKLIYYLKRKNYIRTESLKSKKAIIITKKGLSKALRASFKVKAKNKRKDGKWIMIIFDIPIKHKKARQLLRSALHNLNYKMFQQSVWVTPYDILEKTENLLQTYSLGEYVRIFLIEEIE